MTGVQTCALPIFVSAAVGVFEQLQKKLNESKSALDELSKSIKELNGQLSTIGGTSQTKLETARLFGNVVGNQNEPIEKRKSALIQLKAIYSDNVALQKLEVTTNQAYINTLINQAAQQENAVSRQKNTQKQLEAYYKTEKELQAKEIQMITAKDQDIEFNSNVEVSFESVDSIVISHLETIDSNTIDKNELIKIYQEI